MGPLILFVCVTGIAGGLISFTLMFKFRSPRWLAAGSFCLGMLLGLTTVPFFWPYPKPEGPVPIAKGKLALPRCGQIGP